MRPEFIVPVLLLVLLLAVLLLRRERAKKGAAVPEPVAAPAVVEAPPAAAAVSASADALFTIQVWELGVIALGLLLLAAHVAAGAPPLVGGPIVMLAGVGAVLVRTKRSAKQ
jgi:hypothetical protein